MEITDAVLAELDVDEDWCIHNNDPDDIGELIGLIEKAGATGLYAGMGVEGVYLYVQTFHGGEDDWLPHLSFKLSDGPEIGIGGTDLDDLSDMMLAGFDAARATLVRVGALIEAELTRFNERYEQRPALPQPAKPSPPMVRIRLWVQETVKYEFDVCVFPEDYDGGTVLDLAEPEAVTAWVEAWAEDESNWDEEIPLADFNGSVEVTEREFRVREYEIAPTD